MRKRLISKIIAIALTAMMTTGLTACEDERTIPVQGSGLESEADTSVRHNLSPTAPVETEPVAPVEAYIKSANIGHDDTYGEYILICVVVTNNTGEPRSIGSLIDVAIPGMSYIIDNISGDEYENPSMEIDNNEQSLYYCTFKVGNYSVSDPVDITIYSIGNEGEYGEILDSRRFYLTEE